jgi:hypothetical protein
MEQLKGAPLRLTPALVTQVNAYPNEILSLAGSYLTRLKSIPRDKRTYLFWHSISKEEYSFISLTTIVNCTKTVLSIAMQMFY